MAYKKKRGYQNHSLIKCPYCFSEFSHDKVCFKAKTVFTESDMDNIEDNDIQKLCKISDDKEMEIIKCVMKNFLKNEDIRYKKFWERYPNSNPRWEFEQYPVITPESAEMMMEGQGYYCDAHGFTDRVEDYFGNVSDIRICPECHNKLLPGYGKYPIIMIVLIGIEDSGKTVYLSQLMKHFPDIMGNMGMSALKFGDGVDRFIKDNPIVENEFLPQSTLSKCLTEPLIYTIGNEKKHYTLIFYEIAGKDCVTADGIRSYGDLVRRADGIIYFLDPEQLIKLDNSQIKKEIEPETVLNALHTAFLVTDCENGKSKQPISVVISKSDILRRKSVFSANPLLYENIDYSSNTWFQACENGKYSEDLIKWLLSINSGKIFLKNLQDCFANYSILAVSSLDNGVDPESMHDRARRKPISVPKTIRIEEPVLWILDQMKIVNLKMK